MVWRSSFSDTVRISMGQSMSTCITTDDNISKCPWLASNPRGDLHEYSVVYTDRAVNLMSSPFQQVMKDISATMKKVYNAASVVIIPGSGTYAMEACAREFGTGGKCLVIRNGYFSFRWTDIFNAGKFAEHIDPLATPSPNWEHVIPAQAIKGSGDPIQFKPMDVKAACDQILHEKPQAVFAPHVETSTGIIMTDEHVKALADATHQVGGIFVLDCIASGTIWIDMKKCGIDALISAPQKGWSGPACCGLVMLSENAVVRMKNPTEEQMKHGKSFSVDLGKWLNVMEAYEGGGFKYYTTLPTDALTQFRNVIRETASFGYDEAKAALWTLGNRVREEMAKRGFPSVAHKDNASPGVVVVYNNALKGETMSSKFAAKGIQIAGGVPFMLNENQEHGIDGRKMCFRLGLFGLDKIKNIDRTVDLLCNAVDQMLEEKNTQSSSGSKL